ncbi:porin family protein [Hymenobacter glacieicola]|uniref:Outer membrane protein beta-barrel domain-containing protein n=1 Tax=Hymenobacter glacieicola TaxID=1562124 RepID=A0ABQ1WGJ7_9BACT|nr:porin family protein [Hymenobacter glacieicola]GGG28705.1 hypothetical protein GCM10011378_01850 [Hymenobacter glacieicola]
MKKLLLFCAAFVVGAGARPAAAQHVRVGLKAGLNYSNVTGYLGGIKRLFGPAAGLFAQVPLSADGGFLFQPELLYSAKGSKVTYPNGTYINRSHYIDVPLLAKLNTHGLFFELGPQVSFLAAARYETSNGTFTDLGGSNRAVAGALAGIGYQLPLGLGATLRYTHDLTPLSPKGPRNSVFQAQVSYLMGK